MGNGINEIVAFTNYKISKVYTKGCASYVSGFHPENKKNPEGESTKRKPLQKSQWIANVEYYF
ncbi:MAG: hypothetical protein COV71_05850 [Candidatus Omnitrophica bacterium CG11_big_fil_rev_8_21_14_0_20_41_12]|nr:MAG: hypothetical protein COV71_05850 [Candidatus Omnitrophica bacterium CG11_big_fil_rev_8_21_14_0_20_41_12]